MSLEESRAAGIALAGRSPAWFTNVATATFNVQGTSTAAFPSAVSFEHERMTVYVAAGAADPETIRDLFLALSAVYEAQGGSGLKVVKHEQRTFVGEAVPV